MMCTAPARAHTLRTGRPSLHHTPATADRHAARWEWRGSDDRGHVGPDKCPRWCPEAPTPTTRCPGHGQQQAQWDSARGRVHGVPLGVWNSPL